MKKLAEKSGREMVFKDRQEAGIKLAHELTKYKPDNPIILALPRGGVPVGFEIAQKFNAYLDVIVARKIGAPYNEEFGVGAISEDGVIIFDESSLATLERTPEDLQQTVSKEEAELKRRILLYRGNRRLNRIKNKVVILVDDGLATGVTAKAAIMSVKRYSPARIIFSSPVCAKSTADELQGLVDEVLCIERIDELLSIGRWYHNFEQVSDQEVVDYLTINHRNYEFSSASRKNQRQRAFHT